jgi:hypothetical protein
MQFAGDPGAFLGGREAAFAGGFPLGARGAFFQLADPFAAQPGPVAGDPRAGEDERPEHQARDDPCCAVAAGGVRGRSGGDEEPDRQHRSPPPGRPRVPAIGNGKEVGGCHAAEGEIERVTEFQQRDGGRRGHQVDRHRCETPGSQRQRGGHRQQHTGGIEVAGAGVGHAEAVRRQHG